LVMTAHYRKKMEFSWESLQSAQTGLDNLYEKFLEFKQAKKIGVPFGQKAEEYKNKFLEAINDDLNMPQALAVAWEVVKDKKLASSEKYYLLLDFDKIFGLNLDKAERKTEEEVPENIKKLLEERQTARQTKDWTKSDEIRKQIQTLGWDVEDTPEGQKARKL